MNAVEHHQLLTTSLIARFQDVRGTRTLEEIAKEMGVGFVTLYAWLAQDRITRLSVLRKIERWIEIREVATQQSQEFEAHATPA